MEKEQKPIETNPSGEAARYLREIENGLVTAGRYSLIAAMVLIGIWLLGRGMEAVQRTNQNGGRYRIAREGTGADQRSGYGTKDT